MRGLVDVIILLVDNSRMLQSIVIVEYDKACKCFYTVRRLWKNVAENCS